MSECTDFNALPNPFYVEKKSYMNCRFPGERTYTFHFLLKFACNGLYRCNFSFNEIYILRLYIPLKPRSEQTKKPLKILIINDIYIEINDS